MDTWREVEGFPGYEVNDQGEVRSLYATDRNGTKRKRALPLLLKKDFSKRYPTVKLYRNGTRIRRKVHRLVLEAFAGPCPPGQEACHYNGDRNDNRLSNLRWDTHKNNSSDSIRLGAYAKGARVGTSKLTEKEVLEIRSDPRTSRELATIYPVSTTAIDNIKNRTQWSWLGA